MLLAALAAVIVIVTSSKPTRRVGRPVASIFQDDEKLLYSPGSTVVQTLDTLRGLGVDRIRVTVLWSAIAPAAGSYTRPAGFDGSDPAAYGAAAWGPYDRLVVLASARGIAVAFNLTAPGPLWAMAKPAPNAKAAHQYRPSPSEFGAFVAAVGKRYSGAYAAPPGTAGGQRLLPRVSYWTIWNEPNQPAWLQPQWRLVAGRRVPDAPRLYRLYVDAAFAALKQTGHGPLTDTFLVGELAPEGSESTGEADPIPPMPFIRSLYCVDAAYRPLRGPSAPLEHCPSAGAPSAFVAEHPGLFQASGFAHHPYSFFLAPDRQIGDPNFVPLADLSRLEHGLDRIFATYGVRRQLPIELTEYGYDTNPPNPYRGVPAARQAAYLNQAQYLAWQDPRVGSLAQFLLVDSGPDRSYPRGSPGYWSTLQTGLEYDDGVHKPSFDAYRLPIFVPVPVVRDGAKMIVWGMLRAARNGTTQRAQIQWQPTRGQYRTLATVSTSDPSGFISGHVSVPGAGSVRIAWTAPAGQVFYSRSVPVRGG